MYKLAISDSVGFQANVVVNDAGHTREFKVHLTAKRLGEAELQDLQQNHPSQPTTEFLQNHITGWSQDVILNDDGSPAEFCSDALAALLDIGGAAQTIFVQYRRALSGMGGIEGRAKN